MGQIGSFGKREASWLVKLELAGFFLDIAIAMAHFAKASGAMGNYGNTTPGIEAEMLKILGLRPFLGADQILPREIHAFVSFALLAVCSAVAKISIDIWLMSRDPHPLAQEPKKEKQEGSSAMAHKKNPIKSEGGMGFFADALGDSMTMFMNTLNAEERIIHHSSGERIQFKDLFHIAAYAIGSMHRVLEGLVVFPANMFREIVESRGLYGSEAAKEFLAHNGEKFGLRREDAYGIVRLASEIVFAPSDAEARANKTVFCSRGRAKQEFLLYRQAYGDYNVLDLASVIETGSLCVVENKGVSKDEVARWNLALKEMFKGQIIRDAWARCFDIEIAAEGELFIFDELKRKGWLNIPSGISEVMQNALSG